MEEFGPLLQREQVEPAHFPGLEQLICAALADPGFAADLIRNPCELVHAKLQQLQLTPTEQQLICSVQGASNIHDFAALLHEQTRRWTKPD